MFQFRAAPKTTFVDLHVCDLISIVNKLNEPQNCVKIPDIVLLMTSFAFRGNYFVATISEDNLYKTVKLRFPLDIRNLYCIQKYWAVFPQGAEQSTGLSRKKTENLKGQILSL